MSDQQIGEFIAFMISFFFLAAFMYGTYRLIKFIYIFSKDLLGKLLGPSVVAGLQAAGTTYLTNALLGIPISKLTVPAIVSAVCLAALGYQAKDSSASDRRQ